MSEETPSGYAPRDPDLVGFARSLTLEERVQYHEAFVADIFEFWRENSIKPLIECEYDQSSGNSPEAP